MSFIRSKELKRSFFESSGTWTHPRPGATIRVYCKLVGGGGGGNGSLVANVGVDGGNTTASDGTTTLTALGGAGGNGTYVVGSGLKRGFSGGSRPTGDAAPLFGTFGVGGVGKTSDNDMHGQNGGLKIGFIDTVTDLTIAVGSGGAGGTGNDIVDGDGFDGFVELEWSDFS